MDSEIPEREGLNLQFLEGMSEYRICSFIGGKGGCGSCWPLPCPSKGENPLCKQQGGANKTVNIKQCQLGRLLAKEQNCPECKWLM